ncbi:beta-galactosidase-1-like protein 2 [Diabrotica virgifera virgifera]|uniref:Beta-galactosidase n=1 Tax=Diabrotica virgifera virgifera TaxID=50390 RepID=A0A6P7FAB8_DIAVI|nr:beta-galactosidase-1-like protein 2 [Diabrotica virgifera virgifera]
MCALVAAVLPTLYEYYTGNGIHTGLNADKPYFTLNNRNISIYSGAIHYFRIPKRYWRNRLRKLRAAGFNAVETYVPWNLHEPQPGWYDFGAGGSDMQEFLNVTEFLKIAQEEDLLAIVRPGPYICAEWEFGGFPSWFLREKNLKIRTSEPTYMKHVTRYFNVLLPILAMLQFTKGGPVIAFQVENEYGSTERAGKFVPDRQYLRELRTLFLNNGIVELLLTSDSPWQHGNRGTLPGVFLQTANFKFQVNKEFGALQKLQPKRPVMAMEFWTGWFDHWGENHHNSHSTADINEYTTAIEQILTHPASVNFYMFAGGTNFGFMNGANQNNGATDNSGYQPDTTSYDYDALLTESGDYTEKYRVAKELLKKHNKILTRIPQTPTKTPKIAYNATPIQSQMLLSELLEKQETKIISPVLLPMEHLSINNNSGQSYGYIVYRKRFIDIPANSSLLVSGRVCDTLVVLINGNLVSKPLNKVSDLNSFGFWRVKDKSLALGPNHYAEAVLDLVVENWGRSGFGAIEQFNQFKGLWQGDISLNNKKIDDWEIFPLEFKKSWNQNLSGWHKQSKLRSVGPALYKANINIEKPADTYLDMSKWCKGIAIVNNFVLGRYSKIGPQQALYLPAPFLKQGNNEIVVFEHYNPAEEITFSSAQIYKTRTDSD